MLNKIEKKISQSKIGKKLSAETKDKIRKTLIGKKRPKEVGEKINKVKTNH